MTTDPDVILFDLDDTLVDRQASLKSYSALLFAEFADQFSGSSTDLLDALLEADDFGSLAQAEALAASKVWRVAPLPTALKEHWSNYFGCAATPFEGTTGLLTNLHKVGIGLGVITNGASRLQRAKVRALNVDDLFSCILISEEVGMSKPDPAIFKLALSLLDCEPEKAWFVGDHPDHDVVAAHVAGLRAFRVMTGAYRDRPNSVGTKLNSLVELQSHLRW